MCDRYETRKILYCDDCDCEIEKGDTYYSDEEDCDYCDYCMEKKAKAALNEDFRKKVNFNAEKASNLYEFLIRNACDSEKEPYIRACDMLCDIINEDDLEDDASQWTDILECVCNQEYFKCRIITTISDDWYNELVQAYAEYVAFEKKELKQ